MFIAKKKLEEIKAEAYLQGWTKCQKDWTKFLDNIEDYHVSLDGRSIIASLKSASFSQLPSSLRSQLDDIMDREGF